MNQNADLLARLRARLGTDTVQNDESTLAAVVTNVTEYPAATVLAVVQPTTVAEVQLVLAEATAAGVPVQPFSTGCNWGCGSRLPAWGAQSPPGLLLDLSRMKRIRSIDPRSRTAVIEPGVTQGMLSEHLAKTHPALIVHVIGAPRHTSVIGNSLDRGVGVYGARLPDIRGIEVALPSGELVRTGNWRFCSGSETGAPFPHHVGLGPDLTGLFSQSHLGVVTAMAFRLRRRRRFQCLHARVPDARFPHLAVRLDELREDGLIESGYELDCDRDHRLTALRDGRATRTWHAWIGVPERPGLMDQVRSTLEAAIADDALSLDWFRLDEPSTDPAGAYAQVFLGWLDGRPSDASLIDMAKAGGVTAAPGFNIDLDRRVPGFVTATPHVPIDPEIIRRVLNVIDEVSLELGVQPAFSLTHMDSSFFEGFFRIHFNRTNREQIERAHRWNARVYESLRGVGVFPCRINIAEMPLFFRGPDDGFLSALSRIRRAWDPQGILAPGKYMPMSDDDSGA